MKEKKFVHILAILLMIVWGLSYISIDIAVKEVAPPLLAFYRFAMASVILYIILKVKYPSQVLLKEDKKKMALGGLFGVAIYFFLENYAVSLTSASNVSILLGAIPVLTLLSQRIFFKEKMSWNKILGSILSVIGIIVIVSSKDKVSLFSTGTIGDMLALGAAFSWIAYNTLTVNFKGEYNAITVTTYQAIWGTIFLSPSIIFCEITVPSLKASLNVIYLALMCSIVAYVVYIYCLKHLGSTVMTTYINLQPIVSVIAAYFLLNEAITIPQILGCLIIISGLFLVNGKFKTTESKNELININ